MTKVKSRHFYQEFEVSSGKVRETLSPTQNMNNSLGCGSSGKAFA
jgi:hypothetical protein